MNDILKRSMYLVDRLLEAENIAKTLRDQAREMLAGDELSNGGELVSKLREDARLKMSEAELMNDVADELEELI